MDDMEQFENLLLRWGIEFGLSAQERIDLRDFYNQMKDFFAKPENG